MISLLFISLENTLRKIQTSNIGKTQIILNNVKRLTEEIQITWYIQQKHRHVDIVYNVFMEHLETRKRGRCVGGCCIIQEIVEHIGSSRDETIDVVLTSYRHDGFVYRSLALMQTSAVHAFSMVFSLASLSTAANSFDLCRVRVSLV